MKTFYLSLSVFIAFLFVVFGYAQISDVLTVQGTASLSNTSYEFQIISVSTDESNSSQASLGNVTFHGTVINSSVTLGESGSSALCLKITVKNNTQNKTFAYSKVIRNSEIDNGYTNENIVYKVYEDYPAQELKTLLYEVAPGEQKNIFLVFSYANGTVPQDTSLTSVLNIEFIEKLTVLPGESTASTSSTAVSTSATASGESSSSTASPSSTATTAATSSSAPASTTATTTATSAPSAEAGTNFNKVITNILNPDMPYGLNAPYDKKSFINALDMYEIIHCQRKNAGSIDLTGITDAINECGAEHIHFIATKTSEDTIEFFLYYEEDTSKPIGTNIVVYRQFLKKNGELWEINGAYEGYAPLIRPIGYVQNDKVLSIAPSEWIPGQIPLLDG